MTYSEFVKSPMELDDYIAYHTSGYEQWMKNKENGEDPVRCDGFIREHQKMMNWLSELKYLQELRNNITDILVNKAEYPSDEKIEMIEIEVLGDIGLEDYDE